MVTTIPAQTATFPSIQHRADLLRITYSDRTKDDWWLIHAYDYGWRRVFLNESEPNSPVDPSRQWFDPLLANQTTEMWLNNDQNIAFEAASRWFSRTKEQYNSVVIRQGQKFFRFKRTERHNIVLDKEMPEAIEYSRPTPTHEDIAYVEKVCVQIRENLARFDQCNRAAFAPPRPDPIKRVKDELGVWVTERPK